MESIEVNTSFFPPPPPRYKLFTNQNISLAKKLVDIPAADPWRPFDASEQKHQVLSILHPPSSSSQPEQTEAGRSEIGVDAQYEDALNGKLDLRGLVRPPNLDWIKENGGWSSFGDWQAWPDSFFQTSLEGMPKLYDEKLERKAALQGLLNTLICSYLELLEVLGTEGPTSLGAQYGGEQDLPKSSKTDQLVSHIELAAFNMHGLCNELRPRQAKETLKLMMKEQARVKREKAKMVTRTCEELRTQLAELKLQDHSTLNQLDSTVLNQNGLQKQTFGGHDSGQDEIVVGGGSPQAAIETPKLHDSDTLVAAAQTFFRKA